MKQKPANLAKQQENVVLKLAFLAFLAFLRQSKNVVLKLAFLAFLANPKKQRENVVLKLAFLAFLAKILPSMPEMPKISIYIALYKSFFHGVKFSRA